MATLTWTSTGTGLWNLPANWSSGQVPGAGDTAVIPGSGAETIVVTNATVGNVVLDDANASLDINVAATVVNAMSIAAGTLNITGDLVAASLDNAGVVNIGPGFSEGTLNVASLSNTGTIQIDGELDLSGSVLSNTGTIFGFGKVVVSGSIDGASLSGIEAIGDLDIVGTVDSIGVTLGRLVSPGTAGIAVSVTGDVLGGTLTAGTVRYGGTLDGVTVFGSLYGVNAVTIRDGLTSVGPDGTGAGTFTLTDGSVLDFANAGTLINIGVSLVGTIVVDSSLTIGRSVTITAHHAHYQSSAPTLNFEGVGAVVSNGTILASSGDGEVLIPNYNSAVDITNTSFLNFGVIDNVDASAELPPLSPLGQIDLGRTGRAITEINSAVFDNEAGGIVETGQDFGAGDIQIAATVALTNDGVISTWDGTTTSGGSVEIATVVGGSGTIMVANQGTVDLENAVSATQTIAFSGASNKLILTQPALVPGVITGFSGFDEIELFGTPATAISYTDGDLKLQTASGTLDLGITGTYTLSDLAINVVGDNTDITLAAPCFAAGSLIATDRGPIAVECLRVGDIVLTASGGRHPIQWIGQRYVVCRRHPNAASVWPVRIDRHAFAVDQPSRPLVLSPDHAVFVDSVLVPIKHLVNGRTIVQITVDTVSYFHIELACHDILLAEGLPVESYLETGCRSAFSTGERVIQLHPDFEPNACHVSMVWDAFGYAPLVVDPRQLEDIRARLSDRAEMLCGASFGRREVA
jgi:hypothetical protein